MSRRRPPAQTLESLRTALQKLEQTNDPARESFPELKRIMLARIADLELAKALKATAAQVDDAHELADLVPPPSAADGNQPNQPINGTNLDKLD